MKFFSVSPVPLSDQMLSNVHVVIKFVCFSLFLNVSYFFFLDTVDHSETAIQSLENAESISKVSDLVICFTSLAVLLCLLCMN